MNFDEPEHIGQLRDTVRRFLEREVPPELSSKWDREDKIPVEMLGRLGELGLCMLVVPEEHGGIGCDIQAMVMVIEELARCNMALASLYLMNTVYGSLNVVESGSEQQKSELLPKLAKGEILFAYGLSEPDVGADLISVKTRVQRDSGRLILNGAKRWCTGGDVADYILALVQSDDTPDRRQNLTILLVPTRLLGITMSSVATMGAKGLSTNDVIFENVELSEEHILGGAAGWGRGWNMLAGPTLEAEKIQLPALAIGIAGAAIDEAWAYSQERAQFGKRICGHQSVRHMLADAKTKLHACKLLLANAAWLIDAKRPSAIETSMTKLFVAETAVEIVLSCQKILGAYGYAEGFHMERYVRDILVMPIFGGSSAIQRNNIANLLRLPKE
jgi:alkylation response protein AidB-like acyl-CoA dehydrogenase